MESFAVIIRGPAGTGKSTIGELLKQKLPNTVHVDIDKFKNIISKDSSPQRTKIAHNVGTHFLNQLIEYKYNIIVEEIFREDYYAAVVDMLKNNNYKVLTVFLTTTLEVALQRDTERETKTKGEKIISQLHKEITSLGEDLTIDTSEKNASEAVTIILEELKRTGRV